MDARRDDRGHREQREQPADARPRPGAERRVDEVAARFQHRHRALNLVGVRARVLLPRQTFQPPVAEPIRVELRGLLPHLRVTSHRPRGEQDEIPGLNLVPRRHGIRVGGQPGEHVNRRVKPERLLHHALGVRQPPVPDVLERRRTPAQRPDLLLDLTLDVGVPRDVE